MPRISHFGGNTMLKKIGFVGLGTVGVHMAANLAKSDYQLTVFDEDVQAVAELAKLGVKIGDTPMATASPGSVSIYMCTGSATGGGMWRPATPGRPRRPSGKSCRLNTGLSSTTFWSPSAKTNAPRFRRAAPIARCTGFATGWVC